MSQNTQIEALKPCPFCGGTFVAQGASRDYISVWCDCGARGPEVKFPENCDPLPPIYECHAAWNRRALREAPVPSEEPVAVKCRYCEDGLGSYNCFCTGVSRPEPVASPAVAPVATRTDILREWFGGDRYARDYEYLDASFGKQAGQVVAYLSRGPAVAPVAVSVKPLDETKIQGWHDDKGRFCLPMSDGYYVKFAPSDNRTGLYAVWFFTEPLGGHSEIAGAWKLAQDHHRARILSSIIPATKGGEARDIASKLLDQLTATQVSDPSAGVKNGKMVIIAKTGIRRILAALAQDTAATPPSDTEEKVL